MLLYQFQTDDPGLAKKIMDLCGNAGVPVAALPAAANANPAPPAAIAYTPPVVAAVPQPVPQPAQPPAAAVHDAEDLAALAGGWSLDGHMKPAVTAVLQKDPAGGPAKLGAILGRYGAQRMANGPGSLAPKHYPAVHAELIAA